MKRNRFWFIVGGGVLIVSIILSLLIFKGKEENQRKYKVRSTQLAPIKEKVKTHIHRYEVDLFSLDTQNLVQGIEKLSYLYPDNLIQDGIWKDTIIITQLKAYLQDPVILEIYHDVMKVYPDLDDITTELDHALVHYLYYYPDAEVPNFYTIVPGIDFEMPTVYAFDNDLFINLDMYLGSKYKLYDQYGIPKFISERFDKKYIGIDCFKKAIVYKHLPNETRITLLDYMLYEGKKLYFTELMFPQKPNQDIIGYNQAKYEWAEKHQGDVWNYIIGKDKLFSKSDAEITAYINETPFTKPFSNESPGRMGVFIGWKIIQTFMEKNSEVSLDEMMRMTDSQYILNKSGYKPMK